MADKGEWKRRAKAAEAELGRLREDVAKARAELAAIKVRHNARRSAFGEIIDVRSPVTDHGTRRPASRSGARSAADQRIRAEVERVNHLLGPTPPATD